MNAFFLVVNKYVPCSGWVLDACIRQREGERDTSKEYLGTCECEPRKETRKQTTFVEEEEEDEGLDLLQSWFHVFLFSCFCISSEELHGYSCSCSCFVFVLL